MSEQFNCEFATQAEVTDSMIREAFLTNGFTIKDGHSDLKPYVYAAARAVLALRPSTAPPQVRWEALTTERLAVGPLSGPYWLATDAGVVLVGDYRWEQGHDPHGFDVAGGGRVKAWRITHIAPFVPPTLPGRPA